MPQTDEELIIEYIEGNQHGLKVLIDRYTGALYNFSVRFVGTTTAPDVIQETFIKVWKNIQKFDVTKAHFKTWIFTIARNTITDYVRKKKILVFSDLETTEGEVFDETIQDIDILPDEAMQKIQDKELLDKLLGNLPSNYQTVLMLYYQEDMTFAEIGTVLDKPLNTVKSHHHRALAQLRKMIL